MFFFINSGQFRLSGERSDKQKHGGPHAPYVRRSTNYKYTHSCTGTPILAFWTRKFIKDLYPNSREPYMKWHEPLVYKNCRWFNKYNFNIHIYDIFCTEEHKQRKHCGIIYGYFIFIVNCDCVTYFQNGCVDAQQNINTNNNKQTNGKSKERKAEWMEQQRKYHIKSTMNSIIVNFKSLST